MTWLLPLGAKATRAEIHAATHGSHSRGISAPALGGERHDIVLWWRPERGEHAGYVDGWTTAGDAFYFSGTGQLGDQRFGFPNQENGRVRDHLVNDDQIRLLRYVGDNDWQYTAELRLDPQRPWRWRDGLDRQRQPRRMIEFRFLPVGDSLQRPEDRAREDLDETLAPESPAPVPPPPSTTELEALNTKTFQRLARIQEQVAERREAQLIHDFAEWLSARHSLQATGLRIPYDAEGRNLRADLYVPSLNVLVEAKASAARESIRLAIGQLLDYARWIDPVPRLCVLTPATPPQDMIDLLTSVGIGAASAVHGGGFALQPLEDWGLA